MPLPTFFRRAAPAYLCIPLAACAGVKEMSGALPALPFGKRGELAAPVTPPPALKAERHRLEGRFGEAPPAAPAADNVVSEDINNAPGYAAEPRKTAAPGPETAPYREAARTAPPADTPGVTAPPEAVYADAVTQNAPEPVYASDLPEEAKPFDFSTKPAAPVTPPPAYAPSAPQEPKAEARPAIAKTGFSPAAAEKELNADYWRKERLNTGSAGVITVFTPPDWMREQANTRDTAGFFSAGFMPQGEAPDNPAKALHVRYSETAMTVIEQAAAMQDALRGFCGKENTRILVPEQDKDVMILLRLCGKLGGASPDTAGGQDKYGEITAMRLERKGEGLYSVQHTWRVPAYDVQSEREVYKAVPQRTLNFHVAALKKTRICAPGETGC